MDAGKEFIKYAVKGRGISSNTLDGYIKHNVTNLTPNIIEERPMNVAVMDVYSRLMMDRIIFLGYPITDEVANIVTAQLLFWRVPKGTETYNYTSIRPAEVCMQA